MNWRVEFRPEVERDMAEAATWYEDRRAGLGAEFIEEVFRIYDALGDNPLLNSHRHPAKTSAGDTPTVSPTALFTKCWRLSGQ